MLISNRAEEQLISQYAGMVVSLARSFNPKSQEDLEDYIQCGNIGLLKAIRKYSNHKYKLSTYAWKNIKWEILRFIKKNGKPKTERLNEDLSYYDPVRLYEVLPDSLSNVEKEVVKLKCERYTFKEIGSFFGHSKGWAHQTFKEIVKKLAI